MNILLIDDRRNLDTATHVARNYKDAINMLRKTHFDYILLDHDLGDFDENGREHTGYDVLCWLEEHRECVPCSIILVTSNPSARQKMQLVVDRFYSCKPKENSIE